MGRTVTVEWNGICACGKAAMDGIQCHLGATHQALREKQPMTEFKYPWEVEPEPAPEKSMLSDLDTYINFMDKHVRVRALKNGVQIGTFSIVSDGTDLGAEISLQNGALYKIVVVGHPNTHDPIMTPEELANYLLTI